MHATSRTAKQIFVAALKLAPDQWDGCLAEACGGDDELRSRVRELLHANAEAGRFLDPPASRSVVTVEHPIEEGPGTIIGPYLLLEQLGEGGMGLVFLAEQQQPMRRKVALKILKPGMDTRQVIARFEAERQALALMNHPNIARVLDAGETASGRPYFVMELVRGKSITDYCDQNRLTTRERLELFTHVCQAVQHAHDKGVIHRDVKPSNVMVTLHDDAPVVKVIDFGVAKALGQQLTDKTLYTGFAQMVGTPMYMSPEQAGMSALDVDARSDVYSLGVLLYELLTGTTPFDRERLRKVGYDEMRRIIREEEPPRPSTRLRMLGQPAATVSAQRRSDPRRLRRLLRGELDWIVMKALEKDRCRRYETVSAFAADVKYHLRDEPVMACPPSAWYRFRKFARRHRVALRIAAAAALVLLFVAGGSGLTLWIKARALAELAQHRADTERTVNEALGAMQKLRDQAGKMPRRTREEAEAIVKVWQQAEAALARALDALDAGPANRRLRQQVLTAQQESEQHRMQAQRKAMLLGDLDFDAWLKLVAALPPAEQVEAVAAKLKERNRGFDGRVTHEFAAGAVTELGFLTDKVTDISPVRALTSLRTLKCNGTRPRKGLLADLSPLKDMKLTTLDCSWTQASDLSPLKDMKLTVLHCDTTKVSDLSPLKDMKLTQLICPHTKVTDLSPLKDMKLTVLKCGDTKVSDLSPLKEMKLTTLECWRTQVSDLTPLKDMKLTDLRCGSTRVSDLTPLKDMKLRELHCQHTQVSTLSPLKDMKLTELFCYNTKVSDLSPLRDMKLTMLNCGNTKVSDLSPLRDMKLTHLQCYNTSVKDLSPLKNMKLTFLSCHHTKVTDLSPLKDMKLTELFCYNTKVSDLSPLRDMKLTMLNCGNTKVSDLSPLRDMKLTVLKCGYTKVADLSPLKEMKLTTLECWRTQVSDLTPLKDMKLTDLRCGSTRVSDLTPLKDMKLRELHCQHTQVSTLSPLKDMKLTELFCYNTKVSDLSPLRDMKLTMLNCGTTQVSDLSPLKDMKLTQLRCTGSQVSNLSPLLGMTLTRLECADSQVSDLSPLKDMKLTELFCYNTKVSDLSPLRDMKLTMLNCGNTKVSDLSPLRDMKLTVLKCGYTKVADLSPLKEMKLTTLECWRTQVSDLTPLKDMKLTVLHCQTTMVSDLSPLRGMPLKELRCDFKPERDAEILRSIKTLETINEKPAKEFWQEVDAKKP